MLLSEQDVNLVGDNFEGKESAATKLLRVIIAIAYSEMIQKGDEVSFQIIKAIESMNQWTSHVMTSWVEYHINRLVQLLTIIGNYWGKDTSPRGH